jgi:hypothetical protein
MALVVVILALSRLASGQDKTSAPTPSVRETPGLKATQVTIEIAKNGKSRRFRATVMAKKDETLTILTAAHCMSADDENGPALMTIDGEVVEGTVVSVVQNPFYRANQSREIPGPDNAIARLRFTKPSNKPAADAFETLKPAAAISARSYPGPSGQTISVRMIDARGVEHAVRAGNYNNPRWLEWGPAYKPIPGDSGGGVFVMHAGADGTPRPILIGIIVGVDDRGGGASLVSKEMRWIAEELPR